MCFFFSRSLLEDDNDDFAGFTGKWRKGGGNGMKIWALIFYLTF